jgi:simple sugar transport system ATP-binding protein
VLLQVEGLHDEALLQDISLRLRKGEILVSPGWPARENRAVQSAVWRQQKPRARGELNSQPWRPRDPADSVGAAWRWCRKSGAKRAFLSKSRSR